MILYDMTQMYIYILYYDMHNMYMYVYIYTPPWGGRPAHRVRPSSGAWSTRPTRGLVGAGRLATGRGMKPAGRRWLEPLGRHAAGQRGIPADWSTSGQH